MKIDVKKLTAVLNLKPEMIPREKPVTRRNG